MELTGRDQKFQNEFEKLLSLKQIIFGLCNENIKQSAYLIIDKFDEKFSFSLNLIISQMIYELSIKLMNDTEIYMDFIKEIETFEENNKSKSKIFDVFEGFLLSKYTHESYYLLDDMIKNKFISSKNVKTPWNLFFAHYNSEEEIKKYHNKRYVNEIQKSFMENFEKLSKNDWELHKKLIREGINPNDIAKIIRNDEIEKLQEISSLNDFDFNQYILPSLYERYSFINQNNVRLIEFAAFFGSVKCFKYLLLSNSYIRNTGKYAVAGGNLEIIHLCEQNHSSFHGSYEVAIEFHQNDIFHYLYENKIGKINNLEELGEKCILHHNYEIFSFLQENGMKINESIIKKSVIIGNIFLLKHFLNELYLYMPKVTLVLASKSGNLELVIYVLEQKVDINAKDNFYFNYLISQNNIWKIFKLFFTALILASANGHNKIVKLLLEQKGIDINAKGIYLYYLMFILIILYFIIMFGNYFKYFLQHLF